MTSKFLRPRFSVRTLAIFVALVCAYFGAWEITKKYAVYKPKHIFVLSPSKGLFSAERRIYVLYSESPLPFVVWRDQLEILHFDRLKINWPQRVWRGYYLWVFGAEVEMPFEGTVPDIDRGISIP